MKYANCQSHRARDKLQDALGRELKDFYWSFVCHRQPHVYGIMQIHASEIAMARAITGISIVRARDEHLLNPCISWT